MWESGGVCGYPHICLLQPAPMAVWRLKEKGEFAPSPAKTTPPANRLQAINSLINTFLPSWPLTPIKAAGLPAPSTFLHCLKSTHTHAHTHTHIHTHTPALQADTMPADFNGRWILETSDKFEEYLKVLSKKLSLWFALLFVLRYLSSVLQGDVTGWTSSTRNKIIQFHALLICLWTVFLCVTVWFNVEWVHWGFPWGYFTTEDYDIKRKKKKNQILKWYLVCVEWFMLMDRNLNFTHRSDWNLAHYLFT